MIWLQVLPVVFTVVLAAHEAVHALVQGHKDVLALILALCGTDRREGLLNVLVDKALDVFRLGIEVGERENRTAEKVAVIVERDGRHAACDLRIAHFPDLLVQRRDALIALGVKVVHLPQRFYHLPKLGLRELRRRRLRAAERSAQRKRRERFQKTGCARHRLALHKARAVGEKLVELVVMEKRELDKLLNGVLIDHIAGIPHPAHILRRRHLHAGSLARKEKPTPSDRSGSNSLRYLIVAFRIFSRMRIHDFRTYNPALNKGNSSGGGLIGTLSARAPAMASFITFELSHSSVFALCCHRNLPPFTYLYIGLRREGGDSCSFYKIIR
jgi:hypothetical protein